VAEAYQDNPKRYRSPDIYTNVLGNNPNELVRKEMEFAKWCAENPEELK